MPDDQLIADLRARVGDWGVVTGDALRARTYDRLAGEVRSQVLVRPHDTAQVAAVLRLCHARHQPIVTHGGLSGLVYGCAARAEDVIISLEAMNRIEDVDVPGRTMRVEAGVVLQKAQEEAERFDLVFPLDLGGRGSATIGGNISTNAGGMRVVRYGMMRNLVLGLEAVLADGTVLGSLNRMLKNNAGYDLKQLFIGSEGTLGIVTRADLRLVPRPRSHGTALVACPDFNAVVRLLGTLDARLGGQLSAFEVMWPEFYEITTTPPALNVAVLPHGLGIYVLIESLGADPHSDADRFEAALGEALEAGLVVDAAIAKSDLERRAMWAPREDVFQTRRLGPNHSFDVSMAIGDMPAYLDTVRRGLKKLVPAAHLIVFGHLADGNLHIVVAAGEAQHEATFEAVERCIYEPLRAIAGSISAEHGIGLERKAYLEISRSAAEIATMRALKVALDPRGILNAGKVFDVQTA